MPVRPDKFDATVQTTGWSPFDAQPDGTKVTVYDPVAHNTKLYTFNHDQSVSVNLSKGDKMLREKKAEDLAKSERIFHGRRKGVVEFVDKTHPFSVNANAEYLRGLNTDKAVYRSQTGELTAWMDNAFRSKMRVPFYGKYPYEMSNR